MAVSLKYPHSHKIKGTYARSPSPEPPIHQEKIYPLFWVLVTIDNYYNKQQQKSLSRALSGNLPETTPKNTPFPEHACCPHRFSLDIFN